jgi:Xaa-Pro aminopeptidase
MFSQETYARRRRVFMDRIGPKAAAILPAAPIAVRSNDVDYSYRQDNDLLYLTGFPEPEAICVLAPGHQKEEFVMFVRPRDLERETWTGRRAGVEGAIELYGAQAAYPIDQLDAKINDYVGERDHLYYVFGRDVTLNQRVTTWLQRWRQMRPRSGTGPMATLDPGEIVHEMRLMKSDEELDRMRRAIAIAAEGHDAALRSACDAMYEYEIEALLDYTFRTHGASGPAYPSIVAAGDNATILHYTTNDRRLTAGELLLIDAGAEYEGYCADVTRTFPVGSRFSAAQRAIYDLVLQAQLAAIDVIRPGARVDEPHARAVEVLVDGLLGLGVLTGDRQEIISKELYKPFYMHRTGHWLGMDVHDVGKYKIEGNPRVLEPGMVLTVEPGIYIASGCVDVDAQYRGIGVRIEDDVLVTSSGCEVLSAAIPKDPVDLEALRPQ